MSLTAMSQKNTGVLRRRRTPTSDSPNVRSQMGGIVLSEFLKSFDKPDRGRVQQHLRPLQNELDDTQREKGRALQDFQKDVQESAGKTKRISDHVEFLQGQISIQERQLALREQEVNRLNSKQDSPAFRDALLTRNSAERNLNIFKEQLREAERSRADALKQERETYSTQTRRLEDLDVQEKRKAEALSAEVLNLQKQGLLRRRVKHTKTGEMLT